MQIVCWSELSAENWKNKLSAGPFLQLSAENPADLEAMLLCFHRGKESFNPCMLQTVTSAL